MYQPHDKQQRTKQCKYIALNGKGTIAISTHLATNLISNVLYVPDIDHNLLSVGKLIEKGYKVLFENKSCSIKYANGKDIFKVKMKGKSFVLNPLEEKITFPMRENITNLWHKMQEFEKVIIVQKRKTSGSN